MSCDAATKIGLTNVTRKRVGRRNRYEIDAGLPFRHPYEHRLEVGTLLQALRRKPA